MLSVTTRCATPAKGAMNPSISLVLIMPQMSTRGRENAFVEFSKTLSECPPAGRVVAAVKPKLAIGRDERMERTRAQPLHPRRPHDCSQALRDVLVGDPMVANGADSCNGIARVVDLVAALQLRHRQVEKAVLILENHTAMLLEALPVLVGNEQRRPCLRRGLFNSFPGFIRLHADDAGDAALQDTCLLACDQLTVYRQGIAGDRSRSWR